jgi:hypothetical protein
VDALYTSFTSSIGLSPFNTALLAVIFLMVKQRLTTLEESIEREMKRNDRIERSLYRAGIDLLEME